jgi:CheY-like chemotaxis protein
MLRLSGGEVEVETAHDGAQALRIAERFRPSLVLMDIGMPGMSGFDVARRIRSQPWGSRVRLVAQTGWGQDQDRQRAHEAGFDEHLTKPIDYLALMQLMPGRLPAAAPLVARAG